MEVITLERHILKRNNDLAERLRVQRRRRGAFTLNLIGSPGSGKTTLLEGLLQRLNNRYTVGVIEGDVQTSLDAARLDAIGASVVQVITQGSCHLDAAMVERAEQSLPAAPKLLIIENVGNLVCPATFDLGEDGKIVVLSVTEGEEKPMKYPAVFQNAAAVVLTKTDLLPYLNVSLDTYYTNIAAVNPDAAVFATQYRDPAGYDPLLGWIDAGMARAQLQASIAAV